MEHWGPVSLSCNDLCFFHEKRLWLFTLHCKTHKQKKEHYKYSTDSANSLWFHVCFEQVGRFVCFLLSFVFNLSENKMNKKLKKKHPLQISRTSEYFCPPQWLDWMFSHAAKALSRDYGDMMLLTPERGALHA